MSMMAAAGRLTVYGLFKTRAVHAPQSVALIQGETSLRYGDLLARIDRLAGAFCELGVRPGDRIAVLSENRIEYTQIQLAAAKIGAIVACQNWRLAKPELEHCLKLVQPILLLASSRFADLARSLVMAETKLFVIENDFERLVTTGNGDIVSLVTDPELGFLLIYTSGTTGLPKAAVISQRAEIARMTVLRLDLNITPEDAYLAWAPMFHMGGSEHTLASLMSGSTVIVVDGLDLPAMATAIANNKLGWLLLVPATIEPLLQRLRLEQIIPRGVKVVGCMADLVPAHLIAETTTFFNAPFLNSFGATETGLPPLTGDLIPPGELPGSLAKRLSSLCEFRLVDADGSEAEAGSVGEGAVRGPTLFSGYWNADEVNARDFRDGWFRMGDLFRRTEEGAYDFVGRAKYLIKSGGENIYPAEIERVLLADELVLDAAVVRKADARWGEIAVAFIVRANETLSEENVEALCRRELASYKRPREIHFIGIDDLPRSTSGKIIREELERRLQ